MNILRFVVIFSFLTIFALFINFQIHGDLFTHEALNRMGYPMGSIIILSWLLSSSRRGKIWQQVKMITGWLLFLVLLVGLYSFRAELGVVKNRFIAALVPQMGFETAPGAMSFYRSFNGHFHIEALVNGKKVRFLVDTGATDVVLAPHLARSLGYNLRPDDFTRVYHTANGRVRGAPITMATFQVGSLTMVNLPATVNGAEMRTSLLGMRFFNRLQSFNIKGEVLTIHW